MQAGLFVAFPPRLSQGNIKGQGFSPPVPRLQSKPDPAEMKLLKRLFCRGTTTRHKRPPQDAATLLHMPIEVVLLIVDQLPRQSLYTLAQSCYALQTIIRDHFLNAIGSSQHQTQSLDFFGCLSKELLSYLVCDRCIEFHAGKYSNFPRGQWREYQLNTMMPGCKRSKRCMCQGCHPPHLCSCYRRDINHVPKQHVELVLTYTDRPPVLHDRVYHGNVFVEHRRATPFECRLPKMVPVPPQPSTTYRYTIVSRVVQGRLLLFRQIRWANVHPNDLRATFVLHFLPCAVLATQGRSTLDALRWMSFATRTKYGSIIKCPHCMAEYSFWDTGGSGIDRIWQDLGSADDPRHVYCTDMVSDRERAYREAGSIVELFGPI